LLIILFIIFIYFLIIEPSNYQVWITKQFSHVSDASVCLNVNMFKKTLTIKLPQSFHVTQSNAYMKYKFSHVKKMEMEHWLNLAICLPTLVWLFYLGGLATSTEAQQGRQWKPMWSHPWWTKSFSLIAGGDVDSALKFQMCGVFFEQTCVMYSRSLGIRFNV
jgi:hypothetical protein